MQKLMPVGEVVGIIQRSSQDMVVSITEEDTKALQSRQLTTRSVSCTHTHCYEYWVLVVSIHTAL